jgi:hypothetical protein
LTGAQLLLWPRAEPSSVLFWKTGHSVGHWLIDNFFRTHVPRDSYLAVSAVGYFGYYTDYRIIDTWGLNDTHIAHRPVEVQLAAFAHEKQDWTYVLERKPDFIYTFKIGGWFVMPIEGYEWCWPTQVTPAVAIYRRRTPLDADELSLGMPPGRRRTITSPPPCLKRR